MAEDVFGIVGTVQAGNFRVEKVVAEGGFAVVYRALHGGFRAPVALKCLKIPNTMTGEQRATFLEKFREEAELMFRLSGAIPEVCRPLHVDVLQLGDRRFVPFLALEWLDGESLDSIITRRREQRQPPLGLHKVVKMMRPVAGALAKAHRFPTPEGAVAVIHRDLKPENLFVATIGGTESMKILDFGIAKAKRAATQAVGRVTGRTIAEDEMASFTPAYGAREQWIPKTWGETGPWTDVWGLALSMTEALCGTPPLDGEPWAMRRACLDEKRRPTPRNHGADVPVAVEKVFEQALALDPRKRFNSMEAFWSELERSMGLQPSLGPRDDRREPGERSDIHTMDDLLGPESGTAPLSARDRLARVEQQRASAAAIRVEASRVPAPPPPRGPEPSASGEFDLSLEMDLQSDASRSPPEPPAMRRSSSELEMFLPTRSQPPPGPGDGSLEMSLPTRSEPPDPGPVSSPDARASSSRLKAPAPSPFSDDPEPPPARASAPALDAAPLDFELRAPSRPGAPSGPGTPPRVPVAPAPGRFDPATASVHRPPTGWPSLQTRPAEGRELRNRLRAPLGILLLALAIATLPVGYQKVTGEELTFGGVRPFWLAAPLALLGVGFTLWRLMGDDDDG